MPHTTPQKKNADSRQYAPDAQEKLNYRADALWFSRDNRDRHPKDDDG
jgi:hypothetical protein